VWIVSDRGRHPKVRVITYRSAGGASGAKAALNGDLLYRDSAFIGLRLGQMCAHYEHASVGTTLMIPVHTIDYIEIVEEG
jgi:hypothetical protein